MKNFYPLMLMAALNVLPLMAENEKTQKAETSAEETRDMVAPSDEIVETSEFSPRETPGSGFLTGVVNGVLADAMPTMPGDGGSPKYGRKLTDYASAPKLGGYFVGKYAYSDQDGAKGGAGFSQRMTRLYLDGAILGDFKYRLQAQVNNSTFHMKDWYLEWAHWKELSVKVGQYKRAFTFENPYNPWDVGAGDYAQISNNIAGIGDKDGSVGNGGRDQGLQVQGDLFPSKKDGHRFLHYQLQVMNGQGINTGDRNGRKDFIGTLQIQPIKDLFIGVFGWTGDYVKSVTTSTVSQPDGSGQMVVTEKTSTTTIDRNRWGAGVKYEHNDWTVRAEYAHAQGILAGYSGEGKADGWYATVGVPCTSWLKVYGKYDAYRRAKTWETMKTIYSIIPNFQIHKNLLMQVQYNHVHDRNLQHKDYNELWAELYVRF